MKVLQIQQLGSLDDIEIVEVDSPDLLPGQIRVAVLASGLNYVDSLMIEGKYQIKPPVPYRPGSEIVGRVIEVASDVTNLKIGDRIFSPSCGFADEAPKLSSNNLEHVFQEVLKSLMIIEKKDSSSIQNLLYRIDVTELQIKKEASLHPEKNFQQILTELIVKRILQKVILKQQYSK